MTKEKARIVAFNYTTSRWKKFWIRIAIAKHTELTPIILDFSGSPQFIMTVRLDGHKSMVAKSFSKWFKKGEVIEDYSWRTPVVVTKDDIV